MSDTRRRVDPNWHPGVPEFDEFNARRAPQKRIKSPKHHARDKTRAPLRRLRLK